MSTSGFQPLEARPLLDNINRRAAQSEFRLGSLHERIDQRFIEALLFRIGELSLIILGGFINNGHRNLSLRLDEHKTADCIMGNSKFECPSAVIFDNSYIHK